MKKKSHLQRTYSDEQFLEELLSSHRQPTANRRITDDEKTDGNEEQRLQYLRSSHRPPATKRRIHDDEEPTAERQETYGRAGSQADAEATTVASSHAEASTPSTKNARRCREGQLRLLSCQACVCQLVFYGASAHLMRVSLSRRWSSV